MMPEKDIPFLTELYNKRKSFDLCKKRAVEGRHNEGMLYEGTACSLKDVALLAYILNHDVKQFRLCASEAPEWAIVPFQLKEKGEEIDDCTVNIDCLIHLRTGLAGGNFKGTLALAKAMGNDRKLDQRNTHIEIIRYGYFLKAFLANDTEGLAEWLPIIDEKIIAKGKGFIFGECLVLKAILDANMAQAKRGLDVRCRAYKNMTRHDKVYCHLCLEGVGLANLCRWKGLWVEGIDPLIPNDLLMNEEEIREAVAAIEQ
jgi:hypothetical protein